MEKDNKKCKQGIWFSSQVLVVKTSCLLMILQIKEIGKVCSVVAAVLE
jgi:hypothetical protein